MATILKLYFHIDEYELIACIAFTVNNTCNINANEQYFMVMTMTMMMMMCYSPLLVMTVEILFIRH